MTIPFRVKLLTSTAKAPEKANEGDLWDIFADSFSIMELQDFKDNEKDMGACLNKIIKHSLTNENYITVFDDNNESSLDEEISLFKIFASEICDYDKEPNIIEGFEIYPQGRILVKTGIALELPIQYALAITRDNRELVSQWLYDEPKTSYFYHKNAYAVADLRPRSGLALKHGITILNSPATIDNFYRKEIGVILYNAGHEPYAINKGDKIAQMLIRPLYPSSFEIVKNFEDTGRGGFGSTGK
jgi:dUTPase